MAEKDLGQNEAQKDLSGLITNAQKTFAQAREIASHAGVVKDVRRLFDELEKCDERNLLKGLKI